MQPDPSHLNAQRDERDFELQTIFLKVFRLIDELTDVERASIPGAHVTLTADQMRRVASTLSFCAGYSAGAAGVVPNHWRKVEGESA